MMSANYKTVSVWARNEGQYFEIENRSVGYDVLATTALLITASDIIRGIATKMGTVQSGIEGWQ